MSINYINKKAQLTPGLRATALSFQDGGSSKMAVSHHLGCYRTGNSVTTAPNTRSPNTGNDPCRQAVMTSTVYNQRGSIASYTSAGGCSRDFCPPVTFWYCIKTNNVSWFLHRRMNHLKHWLKHWLTLTRKQCSRSETARYLCKFQSIPSVQAVVCFVWCF